MDMIRLVQNAIGVPQPGHLVCNGLGPHKFWHSLTCEPYDPSGSPQWEADMVGYCGNEIQQRLQRLADEMTDLMYSTPGYCHPGRFIGADDPDLLGWPTIFAILERDGAIGFRMMPAERVPEISRNISDRGYHVGVWDVFSAEAEPSLRVAQNIIDAGPPTGFKHITLPERADHPLVHRLQQFMLANGVAPFSGSMLVGERNRAKTFALAGATGEIVATSHAYRPHGPSSRFRDYVWAGLVAVSPEHRGKFLGRYINACAVVAAFQELDAMVVYELVSTQPTCHRGAWSRPVV